MATTAETIWKPNVILIDYVSSVIRQNDHISLKTMYFHQNNTGVMRYLRGT